jgi:hypothetical protein
VLANLGARTSDFWLTLVLQAYAAVLAIDLLCRAIGWGRIRTFLLAVGVSALTPLAVYACFIMPDVFAAVMVTAAAALAAGADRLSRADIALGAGLIAYSAATHTSHLAILIAVVAGAGTLFILGPKTATAKQSAVVLAAVSLVALIAAVAAGAAFDLVVKRTFGSPPIPVPFLTARLVSDHHPGEDWLRRRCAGAPFVACKFAGRLPMTSNEFLWSIDPVKSAFTTADTRDQIALGREQTRFFIKVAQDEPLAVGRYFLKDWADQLADFSLEGMNVNDEQRTYLDPLLSDRFRGNWRSSLAYRKAWATAPLDIALRAISLASLSTLAALGLKAAAAGRPGGTESRVLAAALIVIAGVLANAAVCGGLSGVFGRYEARILAPLILLGCFALALVVRPNESRSA